MSLLKRAVLIILVVFIASCSTSVKTLVYDSKEPLQKGDLLYHLPKTVLAVKVTYTKTERVVTEHGIERVLPATYSIDKPVVVSTMQVNDPNNLFVLRGGNGTNVFDIEDVDLALNEKGLLTNLQTDAPAQFVKTKNQTAPAYLAVYKSFKQPGTAKDLDKESLKKNLATAYKNLEKSIARNSSYWTRVYKKQIAEYNELIDTYNAYNHTTVKELDMTYTYYVDTEKMEWFNNNLEYTIKANDNSKFPDVTIVLSDVAQLKNNAASIKQTNTEGVFKPINGVVYYVPASIRTQVYVSNETANNHIAFDKFIDYPQFGNMGVVPLTINKFTKRNTQLQFSPETGTLVNYSTGKPTNKPKQATPQNSDDAPTAPRLVPNNKQEEPAKPLPISAQGEN